jgi:hypothetical protein
VAGKDAIEPRRAAILAIGKCASDRTSAVDLCDIGALTQLLSLMDTHWKQLGQVSEDIYSNQNKPLYIVTNLNSLDSN